MNYNPEENLAGQEGQLNEEYTEQNENAAGAEESALQADLDEQQEGELEDPDNDLDEDEVNRIFPGLDESGEAAAEEGEGSFIDPDELKEPDYDDTAEPGEE